MKKLLVIALLLLAAAAAFAQKKGQSAWVTVDTDLKQSAGAFAAKAGAAAYGDEVLVKDLNGKWAQVQTQAGASGWMAAANLSTKRIVARGNNRSASADELSLAGKGFTEEVEKEYQTENNLDFAEVDAMEAQKTADSELLSFIDKGKLNKGD